MSESFLIVVLELEWKLLRAKFIIGQKKVDCLEMS